MNNRCTSELSYHTNILSYFVLGDYKFYDLNKNDIVIDVGASIADSSLYFFAKEGYKVISFEPVPEVFKIGQENLKLNPSYSKKINYINKAVTNKEGKVRIKYNGMEKSHVASHLGKVENVMF